MNTIVDDACDVLSLSDERDQVEARILAARRDGFEACWNYLAGQIGGRLAPARPTSLELLRWGPGGRQHFGDPRAGDYQGRGVSRERS
jgi:hypothetical protein